MLRKWDIAGRCRTGMVRSAPGERPPSPAFPARATPSTTGERYLRMSSKGVEKIAAQGLPARAGRCGVLPVIVLILHVAAPLSAAAGDSALLAETPEQAQESTTAPNDLRQAIARLRTTTDGEASAIRASEIYRTGPDGVAALRGLVRDRTLADVTLNAIISVFLIDREAASPVLADILAIYPERPPESRASLRRKIADALADGRLRPHYLELLTGAGETEAARTWLELAPTFAATPEGRFVVAESLVGLLRARTGTAVESAVRDALERVTFRQFADVADWESWLGAHASKNGRELHPFDLHVDLRNRLIAETRWRIDTMIEAGNAPVEILDRTRYTEAEVRAYAAERLRDLKNLPAEARTGILERVLPCLDPVERPPVLVALLQSVTELGADLRSLHPRIAERITSLLDVATPEVIEHAVRGLTRLGNGIDVTRVEGAYVRARLAAEKETDPGARAAWTAVRKEVILALGARKVGTGTLRRALQDPSREVRKAAATALSDARDPDAVSDLVAAFREEKDDLTRQSILRAIDKVGRYDMGVVAVLLDVLAQPLEEKTRWTAGHAAVTALHALRNPQAWDDGTERRIEETLSRFLLAERNFTDVRAGVLDAMIEWAPPFAGHLALSAVTKDEPAAVVERLLRLVAADPSLLPSEILDGAESAAAEGRVETAVALGKLARERCRRTESRPESRSDLNRIRARLAELLLVAGGADNLAEAEAELRAALPGGGGSGEAPARTAADVPVLVLLGEVRRAHDDLRGALEHAVEALHLLGGELLPERPRIVALLENSVSLLLRSRNASDRIAAAPGVRALREAGHAAVQDLESQLEAAEALRARVAAIDAAADPAAAEARAALVAAGGASLVWLLDGLGDVASIPRGAEIIAARLAVLKQVRPADTDLAAIELPASPTPEQLAGVTSRLVAWGSTLDLSSPR